MASDTSDTAAVICLVNAIPQNPNYTEAQRNARIGSAIFYYKDIEFGIFGPGNKLEPKSQWITTPIWVHENHWTRTSSWKPDSSGARWIAAPEWVSKLGSGFFTWEGKVLKFNTEPAPELKDTSSTKLEDKSTPEPNIHLVIFPKSKDYESGSVIPAGWAVHAQGDPTTLSSIGAMFPIYRGFYRDKGKAWSPVIYQETVNYQNEGQNEKIDIVYRCIYYYVAKVLETYEPIKGLTEKETGKADEAVVGGMIISPAEQDRREAENKRSQHEEDRGRAEALRSSAETQRGINETQRGTDETQRGANETQRGTNETQRGANETHRGGAETLRVAAETLRTNAEAERTEAEARRMTAEARRVKAEIERLDIEYKRLEPRANDLQAKTDQLADQVKGLTEKMNAIKTHRDVLQTEEDDLTAKGKTLRDLLEAHEKEKKKDDADAETKQKTLKPEADNAAKSADSAPPPAT